MLVAAAVLAVGACGSGDEGSDPTAESEGACGPVIDGLERDGDHVPTGTPVEFETSPPTGGDHYAEPGPKPGVYDDEPLTEPAQVAALEVGYVVMNYDPTQLDAGGVAELGAVAEDNFGVLVTPQAAPLDDGAAVAFTSFGVLQLCSELDVDAASGFIAEQL